MERKPWEQVFWTAALVFLGYVAGAGLRTTPAADVPVAFNTLAAQQWNAAAPSSQDQQALDAAFAAMKAGHYHDAHQQFAALAGQHRGWTTLNSMLARVALYQGDSAGLQTLLKKGQVDGSLPAADAKLLLALTWTNTKSMETANRYFGEAAGADPTRADIYYFWGDCLLRWGKPAAAVEKFRAAMLRNPYDAVGNLYQTKLWLAQVQAGQDTTGEVAARFDAALAAPEPTGAALLVGAARAVRAGKFAEAAGFLDRARRVTDPAVFQTYLYDPFFFPEHWRPELKPIYQEADKAKAAALGRDE